jgi:phospholipid/cholesterol/gamma-HCH transport system substrate-binding protein
MNIETRARLVFGLVMLAGAALAFGWHLMTDRRYGTFEIFTADSISGLSGDSPVEFHGVEVGRVKKVALVDPHTVRIELSVKREAPITNATVATIIARGLATRGFTGYVYVALEDVGVDPRPLAAPPGHLFPVIPTAPSQSVTLDTSIGAMKENVQLMTDLAQTVLDQNSVASLKRSIENLKKVTQTLAANNQKIAAIMINGEHASFDVMHASADAVRVVAMAEQASSLLKPLLDSSHDAVTTMQVDILPQTYGALAKLDRLSSMLERMAVEFERDPSVLVRGKPAAPPGPGEKK